MRFHLFAAQAIIPLGDFVLQEYAWAIAGLFAFTGVAVSFYNIAMHLAHWTRPVYQLWIVRVLFIVPIYASISFVSIHESSTGLYMEIVRDCYEAFVIYCFLIWILNVIGGEQACALSIAQRMSMKHPFPLCFLPPLRLNAAFLRTCKQMALQFVIFKPICGTISFLLLIIGGEELYFNNIWQLIMLTIYNVSYTLALYGLFLFYVATKDEMNSFSPVRKFLAVKSIVFMTYWQALFIPIIFGSQYSDKTNDFILCIEMVFFAFMQYRAFPWWEFRWKKIAIDEVDYQHTGFTALEDYDHVSPRDNDGGNKMKAKKQKQSIYSDSDAFMGYHKFTSNFSGYDDTFDEKETETDHDNNELNANEIDTMDRKKSCDIEPEIKEEEEANVFSFNNNTDDGEGNPTRRRRRSSENLAIITKEVFSMKSWCEALWEVINLADVCNDAYYNFVTPTQSKLTLEPMNPLTPQTSIGSVDGNNNNTDGEHMTIEQTEKQTNKKTHLLLDDNYNLSTKENRKQQYIKESQQFGIELITKNETKK